MQLEHSVHCGYQVKEDVKADWPIAAAKISPDVNCYTRSHVIGVRHHSLFNS